MHNVRFENLDKEMVNFILKEQRDRHERLKVEFAFLMTYGVSTSRYATRMNDIEIEMNLVENYIKFLESNV